MDENQPPILSPNISPPAPIFPTIPTKSPFGGLVIKIVVGVIVIAVVGTGVVLATRIWDPLWNPFRPEPEEVIEEMITKMGEVKTMHSEMKIGLSAKEGTKEIFKVSLTITGESDITNPENLKSAGAFDINLSSEGMQFSLRGEAKAIGKVSFVKLTTIPGLPFLESYLTMLGIDLNKIKNRWIKYDQESYMRAMLGEGYEVYLPQMEEQLKKQKEMQKEMIEKLKDIFKDKKLYLVKKEFPDEKIQDIKTYHYLVALNKEEAKKVILELMQDLEGIFLGMGDSVAGPNEEKAEEEVSKRLDEFFEKVGEIEGELWVGKKDGLLYRVKLEKEIAGSELEAGTKRRVVILGVIVKFDMKLSNFNKPVAVEAPEDFIGIEEIIRSPSKPILGPFPAPQQTPSAPLYEQPFSKLESSYLLQASFLEILSGLLKLK